MDLRIVPECYADTALVEVLGYKKPNHKLGINEVLNALKSSGYKSNLGIGIVDKDKREPEEFKKEYSEIDARGTIKVYRAGQTKRFIIVHPNIEQWTLDQGQEVGISPAKYNLPLELKPFRAICKAQNAANNPKLKSYFNALRNANSEIKIMKAIIDDLINQYG